jgi:hypothetical protein
MQPTATSETARQLIDISLRSGQPAVTRYDRALYQILADASDGVGSEAFDRIHVGHDVWAYVVRGWRNKRAWSVQLVD